MYSFEKVDMYAQTSQAPRYLASIILCCYYHDVINQQNNCDELKSDCGYPIINTEYKNIPYTTHKFCEGYHSPIVLITTPQHHVRRKES